MQRMQRMQADAEFPKTGCIRADAAEAGQAYGGRIQANAGLLPPSSPASARMQPADALRQWQHPPTSAYIRLHPRRCGVSRSVRLKDFEDPSAVSANQSGRGRSRGCWPLFQILSQAIFRDLEWPKSTPVSKVIPFKGLA